MSLALRGGLLAIPLLACSVPAQGEEVFLDFVSAKAAFEKAEKEGKRVLIYQNWPE